MTGGADAGQMRDRGGGRVAGGPPQDWVAAVMLRRPASQGPAAGLGAAGGRLPRHGADRLVAEVNQGNDLVGDDDPQIPIR